MMYTRKTKDVWAIMGNYGYGWEEIVTENTKKEAIEQLKTYRSDDDGYKIP